MAYSRKAEITITTLVSVIGALLLLGSGALIYNQVIKETKNTEHGRCKYSIELAHAIPSKNVDAGVGDFEIAIQAVPIECQALIYTEKNFTEVKDDQSFARIIAEKMRIAWWAAGAGDIKNVWVDVGWNWFSGQDQVCKAMYTFTFNNLSDNVLPDKNQIIYAVENVKLNDIGRTLREYVSSASAVEKGYYIAIGDPGQNPKLENDKTYAIYIGSSRIGETRVIFAEKQSSDSANNGKLKYKATPSSPEITLCDNYISEATGGKVI